MVEIIVNQAEPLRGSRLALQVSRPCKPVINYTTRHVVPLRELGWEPCGCRAEASVRFSGVSFAFSFFKGQMVVLCIFLLGKVKLTPPTHTHTLERDAIMKTYILRCE